MQNGNSSRMASAALTEDDLSADLHLYVVQRAQLLAVDHGAVGAVQVGDAHLVVL
jgi:hypothetical protein